MSKRVPLAIIATVSIVLSACAQQPKEDPRVAELQKELATMKQDLAAKDGQAVTTTAQQATAPPATAGTADANAALETAKSAQEAAAARADQANRDLASAEKALADQKAQLEDMKPRQFTLPAGTEIPVRTTAELSTSKVKDGSVFDALLERDIVSGGTTLAKAGALVSCIVVASDPGGRVKGVASLSVAARSIAGVGGNTLTVKTESYTAEAGSTKKKDTVRTGIATGAGAIIGGIAGGGKGAAIGAGVGAAAGVGGTLATRGDAAVLPTETLITFTLSAPATVVMRK